MAHLILPDKLAYRLIKLAERENMKVEKLIAKLVSLEEARLVRQNRLAVDNFLKRIRIP